MDVVDSTEPVPAREPWLPRARQRLRAWPRKEQHPRVHRALVVLAVVLVALVGGGLGLQFGGSNDASVGPVETRMTLEPAWDGGSVVGIPPLGSLGLDSHKGPFRLRVQVLRLDQDDTRAILSNPASLEGLDDRVAADVRSGVLWTVVLGAGSAVVGAALLGLVAFRRVGRALASAGTAAVLLLAGGGLAAATFNPDSIAEPRYEGLLASAPALVGDAADIVDNFDVYSGQLAKIVTNVSSLYAAGSSLPSFAAGDDSVRILHVSDIHLNPTAWNVIRSVAGQFQVDAIIDTGDLTDHGSALERGFVNGIGGLGKPYVFIRGNHDSMAIQEAVAQQQNAIVLDNGEVTEIEGLRITGWGDPRFTPDQSTRDMAPADVVPATGELLADAVRAQAPSFPHIALVHDPAMAGPLDGLTPLVLAGHGHSRETFLLDKGTRVFEQGSTGAAGLRGLEKEEPTPIQASVLYFDRETGALQAWDDISLGGLGLASANIERHLPDEAERSPLTPAPATPAPSPTTAPAEPAPDPAATGRRTP